MIVTLQTMGTLAPALSVHGGIIKIDLGALLLEMDAEQFLNMMSDLITQAARNEIFVKPKI